MRHIKLFLLFLIVSVSVRAQTIISQPYLFQKYITVKDSANISGRLTIPTDTTINKKGIAQKGVNLYTGNGTYWTLVSGNGSNAYINGGNSFGAAATIGLNDSFPLTFKDNGFNFFYLNPANNLVTGQGWTAGGYALSAQSIYAQHRLYIPNDTTASLNDCIGCPAITSQSGLPYYTISESPTSGNWQRMALYSDIPSTSGFVPYTGATANVNLGAKTLAANTFYSGFSSVAASGTQITLTVISIPNYIITGSGGQVIKLPDATTLPNGTIFTFNNNQSSGAISVNNNSNTLVASIPSGGYTSLVLNNNSTAAGSWDYHFSAPANVSWSTNTFNVPASITGATWNGNVIGSSYGGAGSVNGILKANGSGVVSAATAGTDYQAPISAGNNITITGNVVAADTTTGATKLATQGNVTRSIANKIDSIRLVNSGVLNTSPATFSLSGTTGVLTQTLANQSAYKVFWNNSNSTTTPAWNYLDSNSFGANNFRTQVRAAQNNQSSPAGSNGQIQYNNSGSFGGLTKLNFDSTNNRLLIGNLTGTGLSNQSIIGKLQFANGAFGSGYAGSYISSTQEGSFQGQESIDIYVGTGAAGAYTLAAQFQNGAFTLNGTGTFGNAITIPQSVSIYGTGANPSLNLNSGVGQSSYNRAVNFQYSGTTYALAQYIPNTNNFNIGTTSSNGSGYWVWLQNNGVNTLGVYSGGHVLIQNGGTFTDDGVNALQVTGSLSLKTAGNKINIATGTNASVGTSSALSSGSVTVNTTAVTSSSKIFLTGNDTSAGTATDGVLSVGTIVNGTSFVINSSLTTDNRTVNWFIIN
jgi:hypothetical protein